jgi:hypothetical protein
MEERLVLAKGTEVKVCTVDGKVITGIVESLNRKSNESVILVLNTEEKTK